MVQEQDAYFRDLARQVGTLHRLKSLILARVTVNAYGESTLGEFSFPSLLTLQDPAAGREGHLTYLSSLQELGDVHGNLIRRTLNQRGALGRAGVEFISEHWTVMRNYQSCEVVPRVLREMTAKMTFLVLLEWLDDQRSLIKLKLAADYKRYVVEDATENV